MPLTSDQAEVYRLWADEGMSLRAIARHLGKNFSAVHGLHARAVKNGAALSEGAKKAVDDARLAPTEARGGWIHNYDSDGKKIGTTRWESARHELDTLADQIQAALADIPRAPDIPQPEYSEPDLLTLYPIADLHSGLMSWGDETSESYDTKVASHRLFSWLARCVDASPPAATGVVLLNGDTLHADDQTNQTPRGKHGLDTDTRHFHTLDVTISAVAGAVEYAARKHNRVIVAVLPGNHDPHAYMAVLFALAHRYEGHEQIEVRKRPGEWWVHQFGKVMLSAHHGDKSKADRMAHFLADDFAPIWGRTRYRYLWTGHLHHHKSQDVGGLQWEQLRAVAARDAYSVSHAYSARAQMQAVTYHREKGEVQRFKVGL